MDASFAHFLQSMAKIGVVYDVENFRAYGLREMLTQICGVGLRRMREAAAWRHHGGGAHLRGVGITFS